jgi:hypothetical protein
MAFQSWIKRLIRKGPALWAILLLLFGVLGYGYWHARSHAYLYISVWDLSERDRAQPILSATLILLDSEKNQIARFDAQRPYGNFEVTEPTVYSCHAAEKQAASSTGQATVWRQCQEKYSRWLSTSIARVAYAHLNVDACTLRDIPVNVTAFEDFSWLLWWVPLPHVGGKPYSYFSIGIGVDVRRCAVVNN